VNAANPDVGSQWRNINAAATALGQEVRFFSASNESELDIAFEALVRDRAESLLVGNDVFFTNRREQIVALAARHAVPTIYTFRQFAESGGLISYSTNLVEVYRLIGGYVGRVLNGEKPADLPVVQPTKFELVINLKTAKALGVKISDNLLSLADAVIE
jgi:putative ABC transport system substrate-binding protein